TTDDRPEGGEGDEGLPRPPDPGQQGHREDEESAQLPHDHGHEDAAQRAVGEAVGLAREREVGRVGIREALEAGDAEDDRRGSRVIAKTRSPPSCPMTTGMRTLPSERSEKPSASPERSKWVG